MFSMKMSALISAIVVVVLAFAGPVGSQMIAEITEPLATEFGLYSPYPVVIVPACEPYVIEPGFANVSNFNQFTFTTREESLLCRNGFVAVPGREQGGTGYWEIYDIYNECREQDTPIFVTSDALLHTYHLLYDNILKTIELEHFYGDLDGLSRALLAKAQEQHQTATDSLVKEAARRNVAYFTVASALLDSTVIVPAEAAELVTAEMDFIRAHEGIFISPIFNYREDYSQYVPRGHYTKCDSLKRYFRTMMWYGRMTCAADYAPFSPLTWEDIRRESLQALLILRALDEITVEWESGMDVWERIYVPTVFFVGRSDDLNVYQYVRRACQVYGADFHGLSIDAYGQISLLEAFIEAAQSLPGPLIDTPSPKGFRLMGQRFIPDSYMLDQLVYIHTSRLLPKGLDVMVVLGSQRAYEILDQIYHEMNDASYVGQLHFLQAEFSAKPDSVWAQNLYWNWLYCLMPFLFSKEDGYPLFMTNRAWADRELNTALGSWTELRHDTILYAKQSYTSESARPPSIMVQGYVEPNPHLFGRMASLSDLMLTGLEELALLNDDFRWRLEGLSELLLALKEIAEKELTGGQLDSDDYQLICNIGETIENLVTFSEQMGIGPTPDSDDQMPVVADVHTDPNTNRCLEEGVGYPLNLYVIAEVEGVLKVTRGAIFSYYEFAQPIADRLTDEAWQQMLTGPTPPSPPVWTASFRDSTRSLMNPQPGHYFCERDEMLALFFSIWPQNPEVGDLVEMRLTSTYYLTAPPELVATTSCGDSLSVEMAADHSTVDPYDFVYYFDTSGWAPGPVDIWVKATFETASFVLEHTFALQPGGPTVPKSIRLLAAYPNPFNQGTLISFAIPGESSHEVVLEVYNPLGQRVRTLVREPMDPGEHRAFWDGRDDAGRELSSGVYFCRLESSGARKTSKLVLLR